MWNCYIALEHDISLSGISLDNGIEKSNKMFKYIVEQRWHCHWRSWELKSPSWSQHCLWPVPCRPGTYALSTWPCRSRYSDAQACQYTNRNRKDISSSNQWVIIMWSFWIWPYTGSLLSFPSITKTISFFQSLLHCCVLLFNALSSVVWLFPFYEKRGGCWGVTFWYAHWTT